MTCERMASMLDAYLDGELDPVHVGEVEWHLSECGGCKGQLATRRALQGMLREHLPRYRAPEELREMGGAAMRGIGDARMRGIGGLGVRGWRNVALAMAACLVVVIGGMGWMVLRESGRGGGSGGDGAVLAWVASDHFRSLQAGADGTGGGGGHLVDVVSSDRHTVKPWFAGKLNFVPVVHDLAADGFPLVGGRLDMVGEEAVAALVYKRDKHTINLFMWPAGKGEADVEPRMVSGAGGGVGGVSEVHWVNGGLSYWAVSDAEGKELMALARAFEGQDGR